MDQGKVTVQASVMGTQSGDKKDGTKFYKVDLYIPGVGAFDKMVSPDEYVKLTAFPSGTAISLDLKLTAREEKVQTQGGRSFSVRRLGVDIVSLALPENARKAS